MQRKRLAGTPAQSAFTFKIMSLNHPHYSPYFAPYFALLDEEIYKRKQLTDVQKLHRQKIKQDPDREINHQCLLVQPNFFLVQ